MGNENECTNSLCHMTKMTTMSIYGKKLKTLLLWNKKADDLGYWYEALGVRVLPNLFK